MILGSCPYDDCQHPLMIPFASPGQMERHECDGCERVIWTLHSRLDPWSMTEADFMAEYEVNEEARQITARPIPTEDSE